MILEGPFSPRIFQEGKAKMKQHHPTAELWLWGQHQPSSQHSQHHHLVHPFPRSTRPLLLC